MGCTQVTAGSHDPSPSEGSTGMVGIREKGPGSARKQGRHPGEMGFKVDDDKCLARRPG